MYETWHLTRQRADGEDAFSATHERGKKKQAPKGSDALDLGIVFLENAYRCVKEEGRFGIVISNSIASIIHGVIFHPRDGSMTRGIFLGCFLGYLRKVGIVDAIGAGGSGGSLAIGYLDQVPFPRFPVEVQEDIARLYHNPLPPPSAQATLANFIQWHREWNLGLGICELDKEMKALQQTLAAVQEEIIEGKTVNLPFA